MFTFVNERFVNTLYACHLHLANPEYVNSHRSRAIAQSAQSQRLLSVSLLVLSLCVV